MSDADGGGRAPGNGLEAGRSGDAGGVPRHAGAPAARRASREQRQPRVPQDPRQHRQRRAALRAALRGRWRSRPRSSARRSSTAASSPSCSPASAPTPMGSAPIKQYAFHIPLEDWIDLAWFHALIDRVGLYVGVEWTGSPYEPLAKVSPQLEADEEFHTKSGFRHLREICATPEGKAAAQERLAKWWPAALDMFGRSTSKNSPIYVKWGIKQHTNEELRQKYIAEAVPEIVKLGLDGARQPGEPPLPLGGPHGDRLSPWKPASASSSSTGRRPTPTTGRWSPSCAPPPSAPPPTRPCGSSVVRSASPKFFCSGADISTLQGADPGRASPTSWSQAQGAVDAIAARAQALHRRDRRALHRRRPRDRARLRLPLRLDRRATSSASPR